jgi:hypothetical protein
MRRPEELKRVAGGKLVVGCHQKPFGVVGKAAILEILRACMNFGEVRALVVMDIVGQKQHQDRRRHNNTSESLTGMT